MVQNSRCSHCSSDLLPTAAAAPVQASQTALVQLAVKYSDPLPYENNDYASKLELEAAKQQLEAAEARLHHLQQQQQQQQRQQGQVEHTGAGG